MDQKRDRTEIIQQNRIRPQRIRLIPMTPEMYYSYFKEYENDPDLCMDMAEYQHYTYNEEKVSKYIQCQKDLNRINLAIMSGDDIAGEIIIKDMVEHARATMSIALKNAGYKDLGIGTLAEILAVQYVFHELDIPVLYADTIKTNTRSQHVLEKAGFSFVREDHMFKYYEIHREKA